MFWATPLTSKVKLRHRSFNFSHHDFGTSICKEILNEPYCFLLCKYESSVLLHWIHNTLFFGAACSTITAHVYLMLLTSLNGDDLRAKANLKRFRSNERKTKIERTFSSVIYLSIFWAFFIIQTQNDIKFHTWTSVVCACKKILLHT